MYWKCNSTNSNHIDTLLNDPEVTLQQLMDEEDILQECKSQNKKLVDFLCRPEIMEELVTFATVDPPTDLDERIRFKYPNIACELLTCDIPAINEHLAANEPLSKLYAFLEGKPPLNPLLASFFCKTLGMLVARKSEQNWYLYQITCLKVLEFLQSKENFFTLLLNHLGTSAVMDFMLKLITQIEGSDIRQNLINWLETQRVIPSLIALFKPDIDADRHCNVSQLISDVIRKSREKLATSSPPQSDPILNVLEMQETVSELLDHMLSGEDKSESGIVGGIAVLLTLIEIPQPRSPSYGSYADETTTLPTEEDTPPAPSAAPTTPAPTAPPVVQSTVEAILPRLKDFHDLLLNPPQKPPVKTTVGTLDPPLGNTRLQVARLIAALIATNTPTVNQELTSLGTIEVLLDLFFKYQWNNFLHTQVEQCIASALKHQTIASGEGDPQIHCLVENLLVKCDLLRRIVDAWEENETNQLREKGKRRGYMGHLIQIANHVVDQIQSCSLRPVLAKQLSPEVLAVWEEFVSHRLNEVNKKHNILLGGSLPAHTILQGLEKEDANSKHMTFQSDSSLHETYSDYQLQEMAPNFVENFTFHDDEFGEEEADIPSSVDRPPKMTVTVDEDADKQYEWYKRVCAKGIRSLEDAEENAWEDTTPGNFQTSENESRYFGTQYGPNADRAQDEEWDDDDDEDDKEEDESRRPTKSDVRMDVDVNDIWSSGAATLDSITDFQNPWGSGPNAGPNMETFGAPLDSGWADFSSFETNFTSSTQLNDSQNSIEESVPGESSAAKPDPDVAFFKLLKRDEEKGSLDSQTVPEPLPSSSEIDTIETPEPNASGSDSMPKSPGVSFVKADANANPTTCPEDVTLSATAMVDEVATAAAEAVRGFVADKLNVDNQRFLENTQDDSVTSAPTDAEEDSLQSAASEDPQEQREDETCVTEDLSSKAA